MKFNLISVFLLLFLGQPLVLCCSSVSIDPRSSKILYDDGHMIAEGFGISFLKYSKSNDSLIFEIRKKMFSASYLMKIRKKPNFSFILETFNVDEPDHDCMRNSSERLRKRIVTCKGPITLRFVWTKEERNNLRRSRNERRGKGPFKVVVFVGNLFQAHVIGVDNFTLANYDSGQGMDSFFVLSNVNSNSSRIMVVDGKQRSEHAFVVEAIPSYFWLDCKLINFSELRPFSCKGNVILRRFEMADADR